MKFIIKISSSINSVSKLPTSIILILVLTSLLSYGLGLVSNNFAMAIPNAEQIQLSQRDRTNKLPRAIAKKVLSDASKRSGVRIANLRITQITPKTFGNPCIFQFGEVCTKEYRPIQGWEVIIKVKEQSWTYHVNKPGSQILLDPKVDVSSNTQLPKAIADAVLSDASRRSEVAVANLKVTQATPKTFSNPCRFNFGDICTQEYNPVEGWEVIVKVKDQSWTYHVNKSGSQVVLDPKISV
ncbi:MAG: hypothetical protein KME21_09885 [Desmonostoc vinosum HA7617-LM4]|jgi:uncharacterized protein YcnI|nr:hypothetical protein [Desmonostoc vinosum HA7617-LM4]